LLNECFIVDFEGSKINKLVKSDEDLEKTKSFLRE
jgi:hypothetical protein